MGHSLKEWMDSGTVFPGFLCVVSPKSIPSRASAKTPPGHMFVTVEDDVSRRREARVAVHSAVDSPTDCPAVYESFLVRERLLPLVFAVRTTGEVNLFITLILKCSQRTGVILHNDNIHITFKDQQH